MCVHAQAAGLQAREAEAQAAREAALALQQATARELSTMQMTAKAREADARAARQQLQVGGQPSARGRVDGAGGPTAHAYGIHAETLEPKLCVCGGGSVCADAHASCCLLSVQAGLLRPHQSTASPPPSVHTTCGYACVDAGLPGRVCGCNHARGGAPGGAAGPAGKAG